MCILLMKYGADPSIEDSEGEKFILNLWCHSSSFNVYLSPAVV